MVVLVNIFVVDVRADAAMSDTLTGVEIIATTDGVIVLECKVSVSYSAYVLCGVVADALPNALSGAIMGFVLGIRAEVSADMNVRVFAAVTAVLEFALPTPLEKLDCRAAFDR